MSLQTIPLWIPLQADGITQVQHPGELLRSLAKSMVPASHGVVRPGTAVGAGNLGDFAATVVPGVMQLTVAAGAAFIIGRENTLQSSGNYYAFSEAPETISWPANSSGSTRMDSLILRIADPQYGSIGGNPLGAWWDAVAGSSGSARADSDFNLGGPKYIPGGWIRLYDISVPNAATQLTQANVSFQAGYAGSLGYKPMFSTNTFGSGYIGQTGVETDTGKLVVWNGSAWVSLLPVSSGVNGQATTSGTDSTVSGTYVNMAGTGAQVSFSLVKRWAYTRTRLHIAAGWFSATNACQGKFALNLNGTDYDLATDNLAGANQGITSTGFRTVSGIPAGTYTVTCRWLRASGTGTVSRTTGQWLSAEAVECA
jgi:hypothetical protein